jgi:hypothetical protein
MIYRGLAFLVDIRGRTAKRITIYAALPSIADSSCQLFIHSSHVHLFWVAAASSLIISISILCADQPGITAASVRSSPHLCLVLPGMAAASCLPAVWCSLFHHVSVYIPGIAAVNCQILFIFQVSAAIYQILSGRTMCVVFPGKAAASSCSFHIRNM